NVLTLCTGKKNCLRRLSGPQSQPSGSPCGGETKLSVSIFKIVAVLRLAVRPRRVGAMNHIFRATAVGLALATTGFVSANASVPLPVVQQASGIPTLAPVLKKITPAVVGISIKGRAADGNAQQRKSRDAKPATVDQQARAAGSGVIIDARQGLVIT